MKTISCIIPAYNEEKKIAHLLEVLRQFMGDGFEVIVIDDMSSDRTREIVRKFSNVRLIEHEGNEGKSKSVADGIINSNGSHIFLMDADLYFLTKKNIEDLLKPIIHDQADMSISLKKNAWPLFPFKKIDYLSGERIMPRKFFLPLVEEISSLPGYGLEVFINRNIIIKNRLKIMVIKWPNVVNKFHNHKDGFIHGTLTILKIWWNVLCTASIIELYKQNWALNKLIISHDET